MEGIQKTFQGMRLGDAGLSLHFHEAEVYLWRVEILGPGFFYTSKGTELRQN